MYMYIAEEYFHWHFLENFRAGNPSPPPIPQEVGSERRQKHFSDRDGKWLNISRFAYRKQMSL